MNFCQLFSDRKTPIYIDRLSPLNCMSSTLTKLKINFETFTQCLFLLNGNFECLTTLIVDIKLIYYPVVRIDNTVCKRF